MSAMDACLFGLTFPAHEQAGQSDACEGNRSASCDESMQTAPRKRRFIFDKLPNRF
ncbi:hypothetical protein [Sphingobium sp.]|uniref:hypothetical protein n=1 Tax=Sphingobium sp. TaxID=1912891 RepID=UPI0028BD229E|nr:hypothetical protein [Sphingobium sp.]